MADIDGPYDLPVGSGDNEAPDEEAATQDAEQRDADAVLVLPPLPRPHYSKRAEFCCGATTILTGVVLAAGVAVAVIFAPTSSLSPTAKIVCAALIGVECTVALVCLLVLACGDPGVVKRTPETIEPMPPAVAERLRAGESLEGLQNFVDKKGVYCVKCCVWRPARAVHCSTCGRCCRDFDHHCGFYGRCIAKKNLPYFFAVPFTGYLAVLTSIVFAGLAIWS